MRRNGRTTSRTSSASRRCTEPPSPLHRDALAEAPQARGRNASPQRVPTTRSYDVWPRREAVCPRPSSLAAELAISSQCEPPAPLVSPLSAPCQPGPICLGRGLRPHEPRGRTGRRPRPAFACDVGAASHCAERERMGARHACLHGTRSTHGRRACVHGHAHVTMRYSPDPTATEITTERPPGSSVQPQLAFGTRRGTNDEKRPRMVLPLPVARSTQPHSLSVA